VQVDEFLEESVRRFPDKVALICGEQRLTYRKIDQLSNRLAAALMGLGVQRGDRVVVCLDNTAEAVISIFATLKASAVFVMLDPTTKGERLTYILNNCRATVLVLHQNKVNSVMESLVECPHLKTALVAGEEPLVFPAGGKNVVSLNQILETPNGNDQARPKKCIDVDLAALIYTSGSTGRPKGVMLTHLNMVSASNAVIAYLENTSDDVILCLLRLSHSYGLYQVLTAFLVGGTVVLERSLAYPYAVVEKMVRERVTGLPMVPTVAAVLLQLDLQRYDFSSLRYITNAGAALPVEHLRKLRQILPQVEIYSMYGQTECKRISYLPPDQVETRAGSVGIPIPNEEVYIVDEQGRPVGPGVVGELVVRGSHVMRGYWEMPEETERSLRPGPIPGEKVLYTGDLFWRDAEGYLYFVSRKDDIIKTRGEKVSPKEVEEVLYTLDGVLEAAVVGVPDHILGQAVKAVITLREGTRLSEKDVLRHCAQHLEDFKVPKRVEFRDALPKTPSGKISRSELSMPMETQP